MINAAVGYLSLPLIFVLEELFPYKKGGRGRLRHAAVNAVIAFIGAAITIAGISLLIAPALSSAGAFRGGLLYVLELPRMLEAAACFVLLDLWMYLWHRANHRVRPLWLLHRAHHNDVRMDSTTAARFHPLEIALSTLFNLPVFAALGCDMGMLTAYNAVFVPAIFFHHSNIALPDAADRFLRLAIVTPGMHRVHHSIEARETDANYGSVFSFWDRIFRSYCGREDGRAITFGLPVLREERWQGVVGFMAIPFFQVKEAREAGPAVRR